MQNRECQRPLERTEGTGPVSSEKLNSTSKSQRARPGCHGTKDTNRHKPATRKGAAQRDEVRKAPCLSLRALELAKRHLPPVPTSVPGVGTAREVRGCGWQLLSEQCQACDGKSLQRKRKGQGEVSGEAWSDEVHR